MSHNRSLREEQSQLETNLKMSNIPRVHIRRETEYLLALSTDRKSAPKEETPQEKPLSFESLDRNYPADRVERYFS